MGYDAVVQTEIDAESVASDSDVSDSSPKLQSPSFEPLTFDFENLGAEGYSNTAKFTTTTTSEGSRLTSIKSAIRSLASETHSYDIVEDDDYKAIDRVQQYCFSSPSIPSTAQNNGDHTSKNADGDGGADATAARDASPQPIIRAATASRSVPLRHPTPDLQSLQGAYLCNVERLEKTAERLSLESDIGEALRDTNLQSPTSARFGGDNADCTSPFPGTPATRSRSNSGKLINNAAVSNGYQTRSNGPSPRNSVRSAASSRAANRLRSGSVASKLAQVVEPENEDQEVQVAAVADEHHQPDNSTVDGVAPPTPLQNYTETTPVEKVSDGEASTSEMPANERPPTRGSIDTYRQAANLFKDFDGVHFGLHRNGPEKPRRISLTRPPLASQSEAFDTPQAGQQMVYYPAPVPKILNLPQRLSKRPALRDQDKRRTQVIYALEAEARKSVVGFPAAEDDGSASAPNHQKRASEVPSQLRASVYFDSPLHHVDVQLKQNSAVATLDSILDAAARAPVSAFTDHPIVGHLGGQVYGRPKLSKSKNKVGHKKNASSTQLLDSVVGQRKRLSKRASRVTMLEEDGPHSEPEIRDRARSVRTSHEKHDGQSESSRSTKIYYVDDERESIREVNAAEEYSDEPGDEDEETDEEDEEEQENEGQEGEDEDAYVGAPTTLLAELQMRQQEQKQRNRTAATAFPNGMHSTLLELDAVAQRQRDTRNQKRVTLAWEDPGKAQRFEPTDEDVPLAVLFPGKTAHDDANRPLGLMEKLQLEENEPLSRRRARLRGDPPISMNRQPSPNKPRSAGSVCYAIDVPGLVDADEEATLLEMAADAEDDEEETLAQRIRRLKAAEKRASRVSVEFANELLDQFSPKQEPASNGAPAHEPEKEEGETLGQRRKRLQAEATQTQGILPPAVAATDPTRYNTYTQRRSMAEILQANPVRHGMSRMSMGGGSSPGGVMNGHVGMRTGGGYYYPQVPVAAAHPAFGQTPSTHGNGIIYTGTPNIRGIHLNNGLTYQDSMQMQMQMQIQMGQGPQMIDQRQRDMIDRWRQSIR